MKNSIKYIALSLALASLIPSAFAQTTETWTLDKAVNSALENNMLVHIKDWQVQEKEAKVKEATVKMFPIVNVSANYLYNMNNLELVMAPGSFGTMTFPVIGEVVLPAEEKRFQMSENNNYNAGAMLYQPISQLPKINTGIQVAKADKELALLEQSQVQQQIKTSVEKLFYGILATRKRKIEAEKNIQLAKLKLYDVEGALKSGKTLDVNAAGLQANIVNQEQELLNLIFKEEDYIAEFKKLTGITSDSLILEDEEFVFSATNDLQSYKTSAQSNNVELQIARVKAEKADLGVKAAKLSYLPDLGLVGGYAWQRGNQILPEHNVFAGASLKWNLQDVISNKFTLNQRKYLQQQANEYVENVQQQAQVDTEKAYRKLKQAEQLISVAEKMVEFRRQELKIEQDKFNAGLNTQIKVVEVEAALAKAEADLYDAKMNYKVAEAELQFITHSK